MRKLSTLTAAAVLAVFGLAGTAYAGDFVVDLTADNGDGACSLTIGTVTVSNNGGSFDVTYATMGSWEIVETHTDVVDENDCSTVPQTRKGNVKVGKFEKKFDVALASAVTSHTETFSDSIATVDDIVCIAAHAVVFDPTADADLQTAFNLSEETAWGDGCGGTEFSSTRNWATYFTVDISTL